MVCFYKWGDGLGWIVGWPGWSHSDGAAGVSQAMGGVNLEERVLWVSGLANQVLETVRGLFWIFRKMRLTGFGVMLIRVMNH